VLEILVVDNDTTPTAREKVSTFGHDLIRYVHEPQPGLAAARNRALDEAHGTVLVFIDDDETAGPLWPQGLVDTMDTTGAALVGGPVETVFTHSPADWVEAGGFFDRPSDPDNSTQHWLRSGNLAIDLAQTQRINLRFHPAFGLSGGEDVAFSRQARSHGLDLRWSATASVSESVGPDRTNLKWLYHRQQNSACNWTRVDVMLDRRPLTYGKAIARATIRLAQGLAYTFAGLATGNRVRTNQGLMLVARSHGTYTGLIGRHSTPYS